MQEDLIANNFVDNINSRLVKRNVRLVTFVFIFTCIYAVIAMADWYLYIISEKVATPLFYFFYLRNIMPVIAMLILAISVIGMSMSLRASRLLQSSIEKKEAGIFNQGYKLYNRAATINVVSLSIGILSISFRVVMKYVFTSSGF